MAIETVITDFIEGLSASEIEKVGTADQVQLLIEEKDDDGNTISQSFEYFDSVDEANAKVEALENA